MTKPAALPLPDMSIDPWRDAHAAWTPAPGDRVARAEKQKFTKPMLWRHLIDPADRALVVTCARQVVDDEPAPGFAFAARLLERLRARADDTSRTPAARDQARRVDATLSRHLHELPDLLEHVRALRAEAAH